MYKTVNLENTTNVTLSSVCRSRYKPIFTHIPYNGLMNKERNSGNTKASSPLRQNWILRALNHCQDITVRGSTKLKSSFLPFEELNMGNNHLSTNSECDNRSSINFPLQHVLNQVDSNTDLLDKVV